MTKVAVVTGSNKGIGLSIVRGLCKKFDGIVYITSRNVERGQAAVKLMEDEGHKVSFHQLDIEDKASIQKLKEHLVANHGGIDVLVNNAGFAFKGSDTTEFGIQAEVTLGINFFGTLNVSDALLPIIREGGRVVNVSSFVIKYSLPKCSQEIRDKLDSPDLTQEQLVQIMNDFIKFAKEGTHQENGFSNSAYGMSKVGMTYLSHVYARQMTKDKRNILVNACSPGWVKTDMAGHDRPPKTADEGAETPLSLVFIPEGATEPHGTHKDDPSDLI